MREILDRYAYASPRFAVEFADPSERPDLLEKNGITEEQLGHGLVRVAIGEESTQLTDVSEENLTNALVKLTRKTGEDRLFPRGPQRALADGRGRDGQGGLCARRRRAEERALPRRAAAAGVEGRGSGRCRRRDRRGCDAAPARGRARGARALSRARRSTARDGRPRARRRTSWTTCGAGASTSATTSSSIASSRSSAARRRPSRAVTTRRTRSRRICARRRSSTSRAACARKRTRRARSRELVFTGDSSWAERDLDRFFGEAVAEFDAERREGAGLDRRRGHARPFERRGRRRGEPGGRGEAGAASAAKPARLVVYGDSDFASNELLDAYRNRDLFLNSVNWLAGDVEAISIRPNRSRASRFQLSQEQFMTIRSLSLFVLPEAFGILGVLTWWTRRRPPER